MAAGSALVVGGLLGFLFGIPHTREGSGDGGQSEERGAGQSNETSRDGGTGTNYRPNTSLEQISDWLTKMLVGVGLIQIKVIPGKLLGMASYLSRGLDGGEQAEPFALTILMYFSVAGFVFGFLWARLYLVRWFREVDEVQKLGAKISRLENQQQADAKALALVNEQINRLADDPAATEQAVAEAVKAASAPVKVQIFNMAQKASENSGAQDYDTKLDSVISAFKGLIASDTNGLYHHNHSELSYAFRSKMPPQWKEAEDAITKAIEIRDKLGKRGWKYYEFHRARCRIHQDSNFKNDTPSDSQFIDKILADLRKAYHDIEKWNSWYKPDSSVFKWMAINNLSPSMLGKS